MATRARPVPPVRSPVLLLGAGTGEATCGILYLAAYLRRQGIEAFVRIYDGDEAEADLVHGLTSLLAAVRPRLVGISLKWFHHVFRAQQLARVVRQFDPSVKIVLGGNSASQWWHELLGWDCVDDVVLGDGELPLLSLCRGVSSSPNCATRAADGTPTRSPLGYVQGARSAEVHYSHFAELFLSQLDRSSFSGWVAPGKGCGENCVYCGGGRGMQQATFGRATSFLRPVDTVRRDHLEVAPFVWQFRYDFGGGTAAFLDQLWSGLDLSHHATTYFLWGAPPPALIETLARTFERVYLVLDIGCYAQSQRDELMRRGLLKPCPSNRQLLTAIDQCQRHPNLRLEVGGIAGLPFTTPRALDEERRLIEKLLARGCAIAYQRLESQPGALVTEHAARFEMVSEARTFSEFFEFFARREVGDPAVPMVRYLDPVLETAVQNTCDTVHELQVQAAASDLVLEGRTRLLATASRRQVALGDWLGAHRVPARVASEPVTVVRAFDGAGLVCAPALNPRRFFDPMLEQGASGAAVLAALDAFERPTTVEAAQAQLMASQKLRAPAARALIEHLATGRFLQPASSAAQGLFK